MSESTYATVLTCIDGAVQGAGRKDTKKRSGANHVDTITLPGIVKVLAEASNSAKLEIVKESLEISLKAHGSRCVAITAHNFCKGNPVAKEKQLKQLPLAQKTIEKMVRDLKLSHLQIRYALLFIDRTDGQWLPEEVHVSKRGYQIFSRPLLAAPLLE